MTVEELLCQDFADDTAYERLVLVTVVDPNKPPPGVVFATNDIRGNGPPSLGRGIYDSSSAGTVESFAARFRPLAFGAAYKIVDFVVEMTMRLNGEPCPRGRWMFAAKRAFTGRGVPARLPAPLDAAATSHWLRITQLYATFNEYRHAVVHRRTHLEPNGELTGVDQTGAALPPITVTEQDAFSRYATALSEALIEATVNQRRLNAMAWYLDARDSHHGCGVLGATEPGTVIVKVIDDLQPSSSDHWNLDGARLHAHLRGQGLHPTDADAELHAADEGHDVIYGAHVEEVPDATVDVDPAALPSWLRRL
jgi:hypothetical protein